MSVAVDAALTALVDLLTALHAADDPAVTVVDGPPDAEHLVGDRVVAVLGAVGTSGPDALSLGTYGETFTVEVVTSVDLAGPGAETLRAARQAVTALWARQELAIREHPTQDLGQAAAGVLGAVPASDWRLDQQASEKGRTAYIRWGVLVTAQRT